MNPFPERESELSWETIARLREAIPAGAAQQGNSFILDLTLIRNKSGVIWDRIKAAVHLRLEAIFKRFLTPDDSFIELDEARYCLILTSMSQDNALMAATRANYDLILGLYGKCDLADLHLYRTSAQGGGALKPERIGAERIAEISDAANLRQLNLPAQYRKSQKPWQGEDRKITAAPAPPPERKGLRISHHYEPVWDVRHQAISTYLCRPKSIVEEGVRSEILQFSALTPKERVVADLSGLFEGIEQMTQAVERENLFILGIPISFGTLASPQGRAEIIAACRGLPTAYRRYLMFLLDDIPNGVAQSRLSDFVLVLRPFGRVMAIVGSGCRDFATYRDIGLYAVAINLATAPNDPERIKGDIVYAAAAGRHFGSGSAVFGINTEEALLLANAADINFLHGNAISRPESTPHRMTRLKNDEVLPKSDNAGEEEWF